MPHRLPHGKVEKNGETEWSIRSGEKKKWRPNAPLGLYGFSKKKNNHTGSLKIVFLFMVYEKISYTSSLICTVF